MTPELVLLSPSFLTTLTGGLSTSTDLTDTTLLHDSDDESVMNNTAPVATSSEMRNIIKISLTYCQDIYKTSAPSRNGTVTNLRKDEPPQCAPRGFSAVSRDAPGVPDLQGVPRHVTIR
ncbi:hypothetical protein TNCV_1989381 [Trichonephila clavipes]|nr:hypothetical protein TNCV_1989381 [Trichonephila clavipes]